MKTIRENPVLFCLLLFLCALAGIKYPVLTVLCICAIWIHRTKDRSVILILLSCVVILIPRWNMDCTSMKEGTAVIVNGSYSVLENRRNRVIVYTRKPLHYDAVYSVHGQIRNINVSGHFFGFDSRSWLRGLGVSGSVQEKEIVMQKKKNTFRSSLQDRIEQETDENQKTMLYKTLLNIRLKETERESWMYDNGFSYAGILALINLILKYVLDWKKRKKVMAGLSLILSVLYGFPLLTVQYFLFSVLSLTDMDSFERTGIGLSIIICLFPANVKSMSFLIPAVYRLTSLCRNNQRITSFTVILIIQSFLMNYMNPVRNLCYGLFQKTCGFLWITGMFSLAAPGYLFALSTQTVSYLDTFFDRFDMPGNLGGITLPFLLICAFALQKKKRSPYLICIGILFLQMTGWSHPFGELTFINVGQGDSILLRAPMNSTNILIDTGKPSAWNSMDTMLKAKGIHHLDTLIITHSDNDHSGNKDNIIRYYHPEEVIETHQNETISGPFVLHDLNVISSDDENESSITDVFRVNQMNVCLMADATVQSEKEIGNRYNNLHCDVLKLGHHGSKTSSSDEFLDLVKPRLGIISSGPYSVYHHPSPETIQKLLKRHIPYLDTKEEGDITILFFPHFNLLVTSAGKIAIIPE